MDAGFLFTGVRFDKKRFAADFKKFEKREEGAPVPPAGTVERDLAADETKTNKRKKRAYDEDAGIVNIFKPTQELVAAESQADEKQRQRHEAARDEEFACVLRKKFRVHVSGHNVPAPLSSFQDLRSVYGCQSYLMRNLGLAGFLEPTPIQRQAIPALLSGQEFFACAPTGSGKTLAFALPILMMLAAPKKDGIRAVILCPTRELAKQITMECKSLATGRKFRIRLMTKSLSRCADFRTLPCDVLVSTPLRLDYVINQSRIDLSSVEYLVLDESDKLFELGFVEQIDSVVNACTNSRILRSLFSATLPDVVEELARSIMHDAVRIVVGEKNSASQLVKQKLLFVGSEEGKLLALRQTFCNSLHPPILLFVQSKERAKELFKELAFEDFHIGCIHADMTQAQRETAVDKFREGKTWVLIATDLLARGMDFKGVNCVINFDFPSTIAAYIHRIGRSGRAGRAGEAITFYTEDDVPFLRPIVNVMVTSGCEVPSWMLNLPKQSRKKHNPRREPISVQGSKMKKSSQNVVKSMPKRSSA
ncbi:hypothetical protein GOP47_0027092 [Adiantum capillus-veneris]|nr:hypothetical protein GOP47_0027092 [Adiantum capillus-veneris]